ncbi:MAG: hypothetical protein ABI461_00400 [Polyangiaceae bacterium]
MIGALGAALLGAGAYEKFWASSEPWKYTPYLLAAGALAFAMSIWFGTSGDPTLRVGDGGVGLDRGDVRRMPWYEVTDILYDPELNAVSVKGRDDGGSAMRIDAKLKSQGQAAAWIVKEGRARIPKMVEISDVGRKHIPTANPNTDVILLEDLQVVGRRCAATDKIIAYEPDARVCKRCERVYYKKSIPKKCECGASLADLRAQKDEPDDEDADYEAPDDEAATHETAAEESAAEEAAETESETNSEEGAT